MKKVIPALSILLVLTVLLSACAGEPTPTTPPTTEPTAAPTTEPTAAPTTEPTEAPTTEPTKPPTEPPTEPPALQEGQRLTEAELEAFELLFAPVKTPYAMQPVNYYNMALCVVLDTPQNLDLLTYFNLGLKSENVEPITEDERAYYLKKTGYEELYGDLYRLPAWQVNGILAYYFGLEAEDVTGWSSPSWVYNPDTDCYYFIPPGALVHGNVDFYDGYYDETDGTLSLYYQNKAGRPRDYVITLMSKKTVGETGYYILSNLPVQE